MYENYNVHGVFFAVTVVVVLGALVIYNIYQTSSLKEAVQYQQEAIHVLGRRVDSNGR